MVYDLNVHKILNLRYTENDRWERPKSIPRHWEALVLCCKGEVEYRFENQRMTVREGDLFLLPGEEPYRGTRHCGSVAFFVIDFECAAPGELTRFGAPRILAQNSLASLYPRFSELLTLWERRPIGIDLRVKAFLYEMFSMGTEEKSSPKTASPTEAILDYIVQHLEDESLGVATLCRTFFISESQLRRNLLKATGLSPNRYILTLRLGRAANELLGTSKSIKQIAYECGFASPYYFSRCFSQAYELSPREYRRQFEDL